MPLRSDPTVWYNVPGVVAAYQPIGAPGPLLARYNQAHGGDNRYRCEPGTAPTWAGHTGWTFNGSSQYLTANVAYPGNQSGSVFARFTAASPNTNNPIVSNPDAATNMVLSSKWGAGAHLAGQANKFVLPASVPSVGVLAISGVTAYFNGVTTGTIASGSVTNSTGIDFARFANAVAFGNCTIQCVIIIYRTLSASEVWHASRQMAYCHVNPDWSAWGRKRRWYYAPSAAGFQAGWAAHSNAQIGTGVN